MRGRLRPVVVLLVAATVIAGCSSDDEPTSDAAASTSAAEATTSPTTTAAPVERPDGPAADVSEELTGGNGVFVAAGDAEAEQADGYEQHEYTAVGTATSYRADGELGPDGKWSLQPDSTADYRTRIVVRRPTDATKFSGTVVLEWLNVSGGVDADPEWTSTREEIARAGHIWVGVSAQQVGVLGGPVLVEAPGGEGLAGKGLVNLDPARYGSLKHPGDGFSFDMYTQIARALREGGDAMGGSKAVRIIAAGESQSAFALTTYANGVQPLTTAFDGFLIHSRGGSGLPLVAPGASADLTAAIASTIPTIIRSDVGVPVMDLQSENDLLAPLNSLAARQDDTDGFRLWEVAGTAHADAHLIGPVPLAGIDCGAPVNNGPFHLVVKAGLRALVDWIVDGTFPPTAPRLDVQPGPPASIERTADGIATGGIRTPPVDVPVATLSGAPGPSSSVICLLLGSTKPFTAERLAELYPSKQAYLDAFSKSADEAIAAGFVLEEDRDALMDYADPTGLT